MSRPISEEDLHAYIDDALPSGRRAEVEAYFDRNPDVASRFEAFAQQRDGLRSALAPIAAEPIPLRLNLVHLAGASRRSRRQAWHSLIAASLLLVVGGTGGWFLRGQTGGQQAGIAALADEASYAYAVFGNDRNRAVEIPAGDSEALAQWMENRLQRRVGMPNLNSAGFRFMGGRVVATRNGPAGMLFYSDAGGRRIAMVMRPMIERDQNAKMRAYSEDGVAGFSWADRGMGYALVGALDAVDLHPVANEARRQLRLRA